MEITVSDFGESGKRVTLVGRLDILGAEKIDLQLAVVAGSDSNIVVDMSGVDFIASIGIRHLVLAAKTVARLRGPWFCSTRGRRSQRCSTAGLLAILPVVSTEQEVAAALSR
jgi:anti-sigma B factor antagonist